jgi:hypothetical protein
VVINMKTTKRDSVLLVGAFLAAAAGGCISVEADIPDVEVTQLDLAFDGVPLAALIGDVSVSRNFSQKHKKLDLPEGLDSEVKALSVTMLAKSGVTDFSFIHNLRLTMTDDVHQPVTLIEYQQAPGEAPSGVLTMKSANPVNTLEQWKTDSATFTIDVAGTLPDKAWTVDVSLHFGGSFKFHK